MLGEAEERVGNAAQAGVSMPLKHSIPNYSVDFEHVAVLEPLRLPRCLALLAVGHFVR